MIRAALIVLGLVVAAPSFAQDCKDYNAVRVKLLEKYGEKLLATMNVGPEDHQTPAEWWVNPNTRTFTVIVRPTPDKACMALSGHDFNPTVVQPPAGQDL